MKEFTLPELGENIAAASVLKVLVKTGDHVEVDQPVLEIETDKATIEVPSVFSGKITSLTIAEGDKVKVGQVVMVVDDGAAPQPVSEAVAPAVAAAPGLPASLPVAPPPAQAESSVPRIVEFIIPGLGENIQKADILKVLVKPGMQIALDDPVLEIETDKATIEVPSTIAGTVMDVFLKEGEKAEVGQVVMKVQSGSAPATSVATVPATPAQPSVVPAPPAQSPPVPSVPKTFIPNDTQPAITVNAAPAAPSVRRLARELGVDINMVPGSGARGRISLDDVKAFVKKINLERGTSGGGFFKMEQLPDFSKFGPAERKPMSGIRAKTAEHLSYAWAVIPHVTQFDKADITDLEAARKLYAPKVEAQGAKLTVTAMLIKTVAAALKVFPQFNSSVDMKNKEVVYKNYFNIGVAVDTEHGLIVPVLKGVDQKNVLQISKELQVVSEKARARKISPDDLQGGCFTISNLGGIGGTFFTPIVNSPEVAILGVSRGGFEPVYRNGNFVPRLMLPLSLSYDHRIIDGADAIRFLRWIIEALENPMKLLVEG